MRVLLTAAAFLAAGLAGCASPDPGDAQVLARYGIDAHGDDPWLGDPAAPVTVIAYEAPGCSACRHFHLNSLPDLERQYTNEGLVVFYFLQWTIGYAYDATAGVAMECAFSHGGNEAFWPYSHFVYEQQGASDAELRQALNDSATAHGYDAEAVTSCFDDQESLEEVQSDIAAGRDRQARASPTFFVIGPEGTEMISGSRDLFAAIDAQLA